MFSLVLDDASAKLYRILPFAWTASVRGETRCIGRFSHKSTVQACALERTRQSRLITHNKNYCYPVNNILAVRRYLVFDFQTGINVQYLFFNSLRVFVSGKSLKDACSRISQACGSTSLVALKRDGWWNTDASVTVVWAHNIKNNHAPYIGAGWVNTNRCVY